MSEEAVKVFISYSWDSSEHKEKVLALSESLRKHGIDCQIDRYHQSPPEGWYRWMMDQIEESKFVLVVCTEKYNLRYRNKEERGQGRGVTWEGGQIIAELYGEQGINDKYIPVLLAHEGEEHVPRSLQAYTIYQLLNTEDYDLNKPGDYQNLYRHLTKQPAYVPAQLGKPQTLLPTSGASSTVGDGGEIIPAEDPTPGAPREDYTRLEDLLKKGKWQEANEETEWRMRQVVGRQEESWLQDIEQFSCADLSTVNRLWMKYSNGTFGFSVQKTIWQQCGSPEEYDDQWEKFGEEVGWRSKGLLKRAKGGFATRSEWRRNSELIFDINKAPKGHLPKIFANGLSLPGAVSSLASRLAGCSIK